METANWLTLGASFIALLSVLLGHLGNKKQIESANAMALKQLEAAEAESRRRLRADTVVKDRREWLDEFKDAINDILYYGFPDLDSLNEPSLQERRQTLTRLSLKIDLMMPVSQEHVDLISSIAFYSTFVTDGNLIGFESKRTDAASQITIIARRIIKTKTNALETEFPSKHGPTSR